MAVTLYAALNPEMCLLPIVVWGMISWGRSQKKGMITCYQCDCTLDVQLLQPPNQSVLRQISEAVSHLTLSLTLAFWFAFGLHPPVSRRNAFLFVPVWFSSSEIQLQDRDNRANHSRGCCTVFIPESTSRGVTVSKRVRQAPSLFKHIFISF